MKMRLKKLSIDDELEVYQMLKTIPKHENGYTNDVSEMNYNEYKCWLTKNYESSLEKDLINGYKVPQTTFWLYVDDKLAGKGDIRHFLTDALKDNGGSMGLVIAPSYRGKGLAKEFLKLLLLEAKKLNVDEILVTIEIENIPSYKMALSCGFKLLRQSKTHYYMML